MRDVDLNSVLTPHGRAMVAAASDMSMEQLVASFPFVRWSDLLTVPSVADIPGIRLEDGSLGHATPITALHLYQGALDNYSSRAHAFTENRDVGDVADEVIAGRLRLSQGEP